MGKPEPIGSILQSVLGGLKRESPQTKVEKLWRHFLGPLASKTKIEALKRGTLVVSVENSSLLHELSLQKEELLRRFEKTLGKEAVQKIQLRIGEIR